MPPAAIRAPASVGFEGQLGQATCLFQEGNAAGAESAFRGLTKVEAPKHVLAGEFKVHCPVSLTKRSLHGMMHLIDRNVKAFVVAFFAMVGLCVVGLIFEVVKLVQLAM